MSVGDDSYSVKPSMFSTNRKRLVEVLKLNQHLKPNSVILLKGNSSCHVGSSNLTSLFHQVYCLLLTVKHSYLFKIKTNCVNPKIKKKKLSNGVSNGLSLKSFIKNEKNAKICLIPHI